MCVFLEYLANFTNFILSVSLFESKQTNLKDKAE